METSLPVTRAGDLPPDTLVLPLNPGTMIAVEEARKVSEWALVRSTVILTVSSLLIILSILELLRRFL